MKNVRKETGIEYLKEIYKNDFRHPLVFDSAELKQLNIMDEFSQWLHDNQWEINHTEATWFHYKNLNKDYKFSEVYQLFLKSREA